MRSLFVFLGFLLGLVGTPAAAGPRVALTGVTLINGTGAEPVPGTTLIIENGRIAKIVPYGRKAPRVDRTINLAGRFVMPGLIDAHYHLIPGVRTAAEDARHRRFALEGGITAVRDLAGDGAELRLLAKAAEAPEEASPRIYYSAFFAGPTWFANDRRASMMMHGYKTGEAPWARQISPTTNIAAAVAAAKAAGVSGLKIYGDLDPSTVKSIVKAAHARGLKAWSHATIFPARPSDAVAAGVDVLSHGNMMVWEAVDVLPDVSDTATNAMIGWPQQSLEDPRILRLLDSMKAAGVMFDDTLVHTRQRLAPAIAKNNPEMAKALDAWVVGFIRLANRKGIPIVAGTDFQEDPEKRSFPNIHDELALLVSEAGLTPMEAIRAATLNAARAVGQEKNIGSIAKGKRADLVVLRGDPRTDMANTHNIEWVMKGGAIFVPPAGRAP
jgi:imidazolonepropionase-like amidohydrolase